MKIKLVILLCMLILCQGCSDDSLQYVEEVYPAEQDVGQERTFETDIYDTITVHICGEVHFPGVYTVYANSRIHEIVKQAGGFTEYADTEAVNQAREVSDGEQIDIPSVLEKEASGTQGLIDINKANEALLCTIPGIGTAKARQIVEYRQKNGEFQKIEDIMKISGIKEGLFEKIAPYITVS